MNFDSEYLIDKLSLIKHPEGGYYRESYKSEETIPVSSMPDRFTEDHTYCTAIYYLLIKDDFSAFHRIKQDEIWHFYCGSPVKIHVIDKAGKYSCIKLGIGLQNGELPQAVVPAGNWFAAEVSDKTSFSLAGCTVSPGFEFGDFEMADKTELIESYPHNFEIINKFTR